MNFIYADTEDDSLELLSTGRSGFDKQVTQIAAMTAKGQTFYNNGNVKEFLKWFQQREERFCYFHNVQYDLGNLFGDCLDELDCTLVGGRMIKAVWHNKVFVDSFNIWPMALKKVGKAFGLEKLEYKDIDDPDNIKTAFENGDIDRKQMQKRMEQYQKRKGDFLARNKDYVFRDVQIGRQAMLFAWEFCQEMGIENLPATLGGLCIKVWQALGGVNVHDSTEMSKLAYFGGRVELFKTHSESPRTKKGNVCYTDINSLYPAVMRYEYPDTLEPWGGLPPHGIATVTMHVKKCELAPLPFRNDEGRILYPYGKFTGTWTIPEIQHAVSLGHKILKVHEAMGSKEVFRPYKEYVEFLYAKRLEAKSEAESLFFKLLMNNLYGRLGTGGKIGRTVYQNEDNKNDGTPFGCKVLCEYTMPLSKETNWCHAAYVTSYGRIELYKYMALIGAEQMIYCDTDSCIFDTAKRIIPFKISNELGEMKLENWERHCRTYAPKLYEITGQVNGTTRRKLKAKGVPVRLAAEFIDTGHVSFDLPFKFREAVAFFDRDNSKKLSVWRAVQKENAVNYDRKKLKENRYFPCKINSVA